MVQQSLNWSISKHTFVRNRLLCRARRLPICSSASSPASVSGAKEKDRKCVRDGIYLKETGRNTPISAFSMVCDDDDPYGLIWNGERCSD